MQHCEQYCVQHSSLDVGTRSQHLVQQIERSELKYPEQNVWIPNHSETLWKKINFLYNSQLKNFLLQQTKPSFSWMYHGQKLCQRLHLMWVSIGWTLKFASRNCTKCCRWWIHEEICCAQCCRSRTRFYCCNIARNKFWGGYTTQFSHCAQCCTVYPGLYLWL